MIESQTAQVAARRGAASCTGARPAPARTAGGGRPSPYDGQLP